MPCHPDRVRRSYHTIHYLETAEPVALTQTITIRVSRTEIASAMTAREVEHNVLRAIRLGIRERYHP